MSAYPHLMSPLEVRGGTLRNRVVMGSMHTALEQTPDGFEKLAAFYRARARGGAGLIVTGGYAPNRAGRFHGEECVFTDEAAVARHKAVPDAVHAEGGKILMQLLHTGRYGSHEDIVAPSPIRSPISAMAPREMTAAEIEQTIADYASAAERAKQAGYDGVEIMGSEGYLINQFIVTRTNHRTDTWGGPYENRIRFPLEIVRAVRAVCGEDFIIMYRLSLIDLVDGGSSWPEVVELALAVEAAGASIINSGIGWHEARIPTIAQPVPRGRRPPG